MGYRLNGIVGFLAPDHSAPPVRTLETACRVHHQDAVPKKRFKLSQRVLACQMSSQTGYKTVRERTGTGNRRLKGRQISAPGPIGQLFLTVAGASILLF